MSKHFRHFQLSNNLPIFQQSVASLSSLTSCVTLKQRITDLPLVQVEEEGLTGVVSATISGCIYRQHRHKSEIVHREVGLGAGAHRAIGIRAGQSGAAQSWGH